MAEDMTLESYLAAGGMLTNPTNVPPRYRAELMKLMATFVDSELAGAAGFADIINQGPGIKERIAAAKIVLEKTDNAERVLRLMGEFGANADRYATHHPWTTRLDRNADIGTTRTGHDMRLAVFNYPIEGWEDAVVMNLLMSCAVAVQLSEFSQISYQPLAEAFRDITPVEAHHGELALEGAVKLIEQGKATQMQSSVEYWWPRVAASFGAGGAEKTEALHRMGLRKRTGAELRDLWATKAEEMVRHLGLKTP
ncbi:1,2-phenylacetyl-CoA epoxidase, catalytic subunit [Ruegeria halocynthiae]|uniref:1,2-phenylacetyl-CoA epoxidase, catalytic subunit n=1 Tax=Ruegeria halocynthiae TaxID=985054 RepID=A0A1H3CGL3_9RHOB|nr:Phenylacetic acid catabolic protein [Ruegeria halocynthiae]SDX53287.1 1,2-phenylacetyl-CoA epoxidase, catalytic subunit [Ruegeria halocynthiae]